MITRAFRPVDAYPVGSLYFQVAVATNPATLLRGGTWVLYASGRFIVGIDPLETEFDVLGETGGEKTHTLVTGEMPAHGHSVTVTDPQHEHALDSWNDDFNSPPPGANPSFTTTDDAPGIGTQSTAYFKAHSAPTGITASADNTGGGGAHNNLPPYIVAYIWKRTA